MESQYFDARRLPLGQPGKGKPFPGQGQFHICLKLGTRRTQQPILVFCCSDQLDWNDRDVGYLVSFDKSFFSKPIWCNLDSIALFRNNEPIAVELNEEGLTLLAPVFDKICDSLDSAYLYKYDLVRTYLFQIIHLTIKMHLQRVDIVKSPIQYIKLSTCGIEMRLRIKLGSKH